MEKPGLLQELILNPTIFSKLSAYEDHGETAGRETASD